MSLEADAGDGDGGVAGDPPASSTATAQQLKKTLVLTLWTCVIHGCT